MKNRIKASVLTVVTALTLSGCGDLLDVNNPNNLVEESISQAAAASAVVNGSLSLVSSAISQICSRISSHQTRSIGLDHVMHG